MVEQAGRTFICSVVFVDLVEFSRKSNAEQVLVKETCNALAAEALSPIRPEDRIVIDTGDGFAITFLGDPEDALLVALKLRDAIEAALSDHSVGIGRGTANGHIRMGVNLGPVKLGTGFDGRVNIVGDGINVAERIMGFALPGQLLVSRSFYEMVSRLADEYGRLLAFDGSRTDQNARVHALYVAGDARAALKVAEHRAVLRRTGRPADGTQTRIIAASAPAVPSPGAPALPAFAADSPPPHLARNRTAGKAHWLQDHFKVGGLALFLTVCAVFQGYLLSQKWRAPAVPQTTATATPANTLPPAKPAAEPMPPADAPAPAPASAAAIAPAVESPPPAIAKPAANGPAMAGPATAKPPAGTPPRQTVAPTAARPATATPPVQAAGRSANTERKAEPAREDKAPVRRPPAGLQLPAPSTPATTSQATRPPAPATPAVEPAPAPVAAGERREPARVAPAATSVIKRAGREPEFPKEAAREGLTRGSVRARVLIDAAGNVSNVEILESRPSRVFDRSVRRALMDWKFNPGAAQRVYEAEIDFKRDN